MSKKIVLSSEAHCNRTVLGTKVSSLNELLDLARRGYSLQKAEYTLRFPECMIIDLSNLEPPLAFCSSAVILDVLEIIDKDLKSKLKGLPITKVTGKGLLTERAITGPDLKLLNEFKVRFLSEIFKRVGLEQELNSRKTSRSKGIRKDYPLTLASPEVNEFLNYVKRVYCQYILVPYKDFFPPFKINLVASHHEVWKDIRLLGEIKVFVLHGGLPFALGYLNQTGDRKIHFAEVHRQNDPYQLFRDPKCPFEDIFFPDVPPENLEDIVIIDIAYSGGSLQKVGERFKSAKLLGLFPKSFSALMASDYVIYAGKLYAVREVKRFVSESDWHIELLIHADE